MVSADWSGGREPESNHYPMHRAISMAAPSGTEIGMSVRGTIGQPHRDHNVNMGGALFSSAQFVPADHPRGGLSGRFRSGEIEPITATLSAGPQPITRRSKSESRGGRGVRIRLARFRVEITVSA
jgi:hypothetical protein